MKRANSYRLVKLAFLLSVTLSALLLVPATLNYLEFYVALSHMSLRINSFNIYRVSDGGVVGANLSIVQNSSYVGLSALSVDVSAFFDEENGYSRMLFSKKFTVGEVSIGPYSSLDLIMANQTYLDYYQLFVDYNNQSKARGEPVKLLFSSDVNLFMFGNSAANTVYLDDVIYQMPSYVS